jgi:hypothetical protein
MLSKVIEDVKGASAFFLTRLNFGNPLATFDNKEPLAEIFPFCIIYPLELCLATVNSSFIRK